MRAIGYSSRDLNSLGERRGGIVIESTHKSEGPSEIIKTRDLYVPRTIDWPMHPARIHIEQSHLPSRHSYPTIASYSCTLCDLKSFKSLQKVPETGRGGNLVRLSHSPCSSGAKDMRPATLTRLASLNGLRATSRNGSAWRCLTMLHPPKFENEKMVSVLPRSIVLLVILTASPAELCQRLT